LAFQLLLGRSRCGGLLEPAQVPVGEVVGQRKGLGSKDEHVKEVGMPYKLGGPRFFGW